MNKNLVVGETDAAAEYLQQQLPREGGQGHWRHFLINNRRTDRTPSFRISCFRWHGNTVAYELKELKKFVAWQKARMGFFVIPKGAPS